MALLDLSRVTSTLTSLLESNINLHLQSGGPPVTVVPTAPSNVGESAQNHLSLYLYHVSEDPYYRNIPGQGNDPPNVAKAPMGLCLYYILTAHHTSNDVEADPLTQQRLMGFALKTFHDIPVITDRTTIDGLNPLLPDVLRGRQNSIQTIMRQIPPEEATAFWTRDDLQITRLSAYYEVRVILLEAEEPRSTPGIVLNLGAFVIQSAAPTLGTTESRIPFNLPPSRGGGARTIVARPARAIIDDRAQGVVPAEHRRFDLVGTNLAIGAARTIILRHARWAHANPTLTEIAVNLTQNTGWAVNVRSDRIAIEFRSTLDYTDEHELLQTETIWPGIYTAEVRAVLHQQNVLGHPKEVVSASNQVSFTVAPRISGHTIIDPNIQVDLGSEIDLTDLNESYDDVQVSLDGVVYTETLDSPPTAPGEWFRMASALVLAPHPGVDLAPANPQVHAFRLVINGAETAPYFIELP
ncbi:MAG TPA: DUF4255 domain-containing protein [Terrimicrobiaceae bacterium]